MQRKLILIVLFVGVMITGNAQKIALDPSWAQDPPNTKELINFAKQQSEMRIVIKRYIEDYESLKRRYPVPYSPVRIERLRKFIKDWKGELQNIPFNELSHEGQIDYILLDHTLTYRASRLDLESKNWNQIEEVLPFAKSLRELQEDRFDRKVIHDPVRIAEVLDAVNDNLLRLTKELKEDAKKNGIPVDRELTRSQAIRAAHYIKDLCAILKDWNAYYDGYNPDYDFWVRTPFSQVMEGLKVYRKTLIRTVVGIDPGDNNPIVGDPVGEEGLQADLEYQMIPYNAKELLAIAEREFDWTIKQFKKVSADMGYDDYWPVALESVKKQAPSPGSIKDSLFDIAEYSFDYVQKMNFVTIPPMELEVWRLRMRTIEEQRIAPFFLGGEYTSASYPMEGMDHKFKMMSMRGNTPYFNFPTVQHELIPGHYNQFFVNARLNSERSRLYSTPFWHEGNAFYWETLLWDQGNFARSDKDKIGMLFWRLHRAARIIFSLNFHLGNWTPEQCVDFLVEEVHHEQSNAEAEVRRSFSDPYYSTKPLYQLSYMVGALQHRALFKEAVMDGGMSPRVFHDAILQGGSMPLEMVRARLLNKPLERNYKAQWRWDEKYNDDLKLKK